MLGLIKASLLRMTKSKMLLLSVFFQIGFSLFVIIVHRGTVYSIGDMLFADGLLTMLLSGFFIPFFLHNDQHKGMARNKIITGHTRTEIYISNYISSLMGVFIIFFTPIIIAFLLAPFGGGHIGYAAAEFAFRLILTAAANAAMCGIYVLAGYFFRNMGAAAAFLIMTAMFTVSAVGELNIYSPQDAAEIVEPMGMSLEPSNELNRVVNDILPTSHILELVFAEQIWKIAYLPLYSILVSAAAVGVGVFLFRRRDLK